MITMEQVFGLRNTNSKGLFSEKKTITPSHR